MKAYLHTAYEPLEQVGAEKTEGKDDEGEDEKQAKKRSQNKQRAQEQKEPGMCTGPPKEEGATCSRGKQVRKKKEEKNLFLKSPHPIHTPHLKGQGR